MVLVVTSLFNSQTSIRVVDERWGGKYIYIYIYVGMVRSLNRLIGTDLNINKTKTDDSKSTIKNKWRFRANELTIAVTVMAVLFLAHRSGNVANNIYIRIFDIFEWIAKCTKVWRSKRIVHLMRHTTDVCIYKYTQFSLLSDFNANQSICAKRSDVEWLRPISN